MPAPAASRMPFAFAAIGMLLFSGASPATAVTPDASVAWTVDTADNEHGTGRANFTYESEAGAVIQDTMIVVNSGTVPLPLAVYAADAFTSATGDIDVLLDGTPSADAGTWVSIATDAVELAPGEKAEVPFTIRVPADARPGDHAAGVVTSLSSTDPSQTIDVDRRLGTRINVRVAGALEPAATVRGLTVEYVASWNPFAAGTVVLRYALDNTGNTRLTGTSEVAASGIFGLTDDAAPPAQLPEIIPGSVVDAGTELPVLSLGWVSGTLTVHPEAVGLGAGAVAPVTMPFSVVALPWSLYALLALVIGGGVTVGVAVRRRARATTN